MKGRSKCLSCGEALRPIDLVPVLSYLFLRGRCRYCSARYGVSALVIETLYGVVFLALYALVLKGYESTLESFLYLVYYTALFIVLGVMALYDKAHTYIPLSFLGAFSVLTFLMYGLRVSADPSIGNITAPFLVSAPFLIIWLVTRGRGLGFGDVMLFFGVGAFFGILQGFAVFVISVWTGAIFGVIYKYLLRGNKGKSLAIPFVPFIVLAFLVVLFTGIDITSIALLFA
jgi:prepilin signal peptidase PulO-like enzyme (type II secretory pathway)